MEKFRSRLRGTKSWSLSTLLLVSVTAITLSRSSDTPDLDVGSHCKSSKTKQFLPDNRVHITQKTIEFDSPSIILRYYSSLNEIKIDLHPQDKNVLISSSLDDAVIFGKGFSLGLQSLNSDILLSHEMFYQQVTLHSILLIVRSHLIQSNNFH